MTIIQLKYFCEVCKWKSINKAAEQLYVTQPAVSNAIKKLEDELDTTLFARNNNKMLLTDAGRYLFDSSIHILREMEALEDKMLRDYAHASTMNEIKIGLPPFFSSWCLDMIEEPLERLQSKFEHKIRVIFLEATADRLEDAFINKKVDLLIGSFENKIPEYLGKKTLMQTEIKVCMGKKHPLACREVIRMEDLVGVPLIQSFPPEYESGRQLLQLANEAGVKLDYQYYFMHNDAIISILKRNKAAAFARPILSGLIKDPDIVALPLENTIYGELAVLYDNRYTMREEVARLLDYIPQSKVLKKFLEFQRDPSGNSCNS